MHRIFVLGLLIFWGLFTYSKAMVYAERSGDIFSLTRDLSLGDSGQDVAVLQSYLIDQGFLRTTTSTEYFGPLTVRALSLWQAVNGIPTTGTFGARSRALLKTSTGFVAGASIVASSVSYLRDLGIGDFGIDVSLLQLFLKAKGFLTIANPTGYFGNLTASALASWQSKSGLPSTGFLGPVTRALIYPPASAPPVLNNIVTPTATPPTITTQTAPSPAR